ncbi:BON domain-containing protein [Stella humosa]|uniref:BON domain-containing protein n=2 Tax=Stella humosa TaxID=94 RepID=A0A3N1M9A0_9PROT|nr:BON domain-containing protein [Stella humosa]BBK30501.1 histidine kinase [Stella humosa]
MRARDVMTTTVHTVAPETSIAGIARLLVDRRIGAAPVVDAGGQLVGIVSESDLMRRPEIGTERERSWLMRFVSDPEALAAEYVKNEGPTAAAVMTRKVVTVGKDAPLDQVAGLMEDNRIKRVVVVDEGRVCGIVSRANFVQAIATHGTPAKVEPDPGEAGDSLLREHLLDRIRQQPWSQSPTFNVLVSGGVAHLWGAVRNDAERKAMVVAAQTMPGIRSVEDHLAVIHWNFGV